MDYKKIGKGFLIALAGAGLTYLAGLIPSLNFGQYTLLVAAVLSAGVNAGLKYIQSLGYLGGSKN